MLYYFRLTPTISVSSQVNTCFYFFSRVSNFSLVVLGRVDPILTFWFGYFSCTISFALGSSSLGYFLPLVISIGSMNWLHSMVLFMMA